MTRRLRLLAVGLVGIGVVGAGVGAGAGLLLAQLPMLSVGTNAGPPDVGGTAVAAHADTATAATTSSALPTGIHVASAQAFDPLGDGHENDAEAPLAIDPNAASAWHTERYSGPLAAFKPGVGLRLDLGAVHQITGLNLLTPVAGGQVHVLVADSPAADPSGYTDVAAGAVAAGLTHVSTTGPVSGRYVLVWFTALPPAPSGGGNQGAISVAEVVGR